MVSVCEQSACLRMAAWQWPTSADDVSGRWLTAEGAIRLECLHPSLGFARRPKNQPASPPITTPAPPAYQSARVSSEIRTFVNTFDDRCKFTTFHSPPTFAAVALQREFSLNGPRMMGKNSSSMLPSASATSAPDPTKRAWAPSLALVVYLLMIRPSSFTIRR